MERKRVFVTVGTTDFNQLIMSVTSPEVRKVLRCKGFTSMLLQIGRGQFTSDVVTVSEDSPSVDFFNFKDSIKSDIDQADLVICHAGAGSVLESLSAGARLLVVINDQLMDNHQVELASRLHRDSHLHYCTCSTLAATLQEADFSSLQPYPPGDPAIFAKFLDSVMGFCDTGACRK